MKVLVGFFNSESNEFTQKMMKSENFLFYEGEACLERMGISKIFEEKGIQVIPSFYANGHPGGLIEKDTFQMILEKFLTSVWYHLGEIDGIYLYLHGASKVKDLPEISAEHVILREIRKIVGPYLPIAVVMDPHGNVTDEFCSYVDLLRCYRHSPHTDIKETFEFVADKLCDYLLDRSHPTKPIIRKLPFMVGGERSVSTDEPMVTINRLLDEAETHEEILSASFHVGYVRHDSDKLGTAIAVVPREKGSSCAEEIADHLAAEVLKRRYQFHYHGNYNDIEDAVEEALHSEACPFFLTDSGDNCGAGSDGYSTYLLQKLIEQGCQKETLVAGIIDEENHAWLKNEKIGSEVSFALGKDNSELSKKVPLTATIVAKGVVSKDYLDYPDIGSVITLRLHDLPISIVVQGESVSFTELEQFQYAQIPIEKYELIVVKQGYISPDFDSYSQKSVMVLTDGPTNQQTEKLIFRQIKRPMFPYDEIDYPYEGKCKGGFANES